MKRCLGGSWFSSWRVRYLASRAGFFMLGIALAQCGNFSVLGQSQIQTLNAFNGPTGAFPFGALFEGSDQLLYGTTFQGGTNSTRGTVFRLAKDGSGFQVLRHFASGAGGNRPAGGVIEGSDGRLYGTTASGSSNGLTGTVFAMNRDGTGYIVLWHFTGTTPDGRQPQTGLIEGKDGFLYGTTHGGGGAGGVVFKLRKDGSGFFVLHEFTGTGDGALPWGKLLEASDGALYGTTYSGTTGTSIFGTIFKVDTDGSGYSILRRLDPTSGAYPYGGLIEGSDGALYGTASVGGFGGNGVVFKIGRSGANYSVLFSFPDDGGSGKEPRGTLVEEPTGFLCGGTYSGGIGTNGTVFQVKKDGSGFAVLHRFVGGSSEGQGLSGGLLAGRDHALYGTTVFGGPANMGTVFRLALSDAIAPSLTITNSSVGLQLFLFGGVAGQTYRLQATPVLSADIPWTGLATNVAPLDGRIEFFDREGAVRPARFYRAISP